MVAVDPFVGCRDVVGVPSPAAHHSLAVRVAVVAVEAHLDHNCLDNDVEVGDGIGAGSSMLEWEHPFGLVAEVAVVVVNLACIAAEKIDRKLEEVMKSC